MHVLSGWQGLALATTVGISVCALHWVLIDFLLDRFGNVNDCRRRRGRQSDGG
jgi:hypothetical protein